MPQSRPIEPSEEQKHNERLRVAIGVPWYGPRRESRIIKNGALAPSARDFTDHEAFLKQPKTGLIRLLPREVYDREPGPIKIRGGGAYYSFFFISHDYGYGSDIGLERNRLSTGFAGADFGMLTNLGEVSLAEIVPDDSRVTFLKNYSPPTKLSEARTEQGRASDGFLIAGMTYGRSLPLKVGSTYLIRSIVYDTSDVLVAFTVTRKDTDGSSIIVWKLLKKFQTPNLN